MRVLWKVIHPDDPPVALDPGTVWVFTIARVVPFDCGQGWAEWKAETAVVRDARIIDWDHVAVREE
ncbi:MAG TPA: hypothetical protein PKA88_33665 [Polyangiaceae bacterium]|nr:hypothetical protein [Polyangiaceae bacterium]